MSGAVVWLTGLPSSGKSTLAKRLAERLRAHGAECCMLDGDEVRSALSPAPGYSDTARDDFYATLGQLAALIARQGLLVIVPATAHLRRYRHAARQAAPRFVEVYVATPLSECARRDPKGLYGAARDGQAARLPGVGVSYEPPESPDVVAQGGHDAAALERLFSLLTSS